MKLLLAGSLIGYEALVVLTAVALVGKERKPLSPTGAVFTVILGSAAILAVAYLAGLIGS